MARFDRYPPPDGQDLWTDEAVEDVAIELLSDKNADKQLSKLVRTATDDESFERLLEAAVRNHFRMQARRTDTGAALRALTHAVETDPDVVVDGSTPSTRTWTLRSNQHNTPYTGPPSRLIDGAYAVTDIKPVRWSSNRRRAPIADPQPLRRVIHSVLDAANGPIPPRLLVDVVLARFPVAAPGPNTELSEQHDDGSDPTARRAALDVWLSLTDNQHVVLWFYDAQEMRSYNREDENDDGQEDNAMKQMTVRQIAEAAGLSKSTIQRVLDTLPETLRPLLVEIDADQHLAVLRELRNMSSIYCERGTAMLDSAFTTAKRT